MIDPVYEKLISPLIESQFPAEIREVMGPVFVGFVRKYFEWMESQNQPLYHARRIMEYKDIDTTTEDFLVYFKEKYLKNIQLETTSNVKFLIKHSLDIYRSKGTPQAIDLLFRLVFGVGAEVYYPSRDLFRLSDGHWKRPIYLEVNLREDHARFVGKEIYGVSSSARGFVERVIRRNNRGKFNDILYLSALVGDFETGELINALVDPFDVTECPVVIGSMTELEVVDGGEGFSNGDIVYVTSDVGHRGKARVTNVSSQTGTVEFTLIDGGYGFTVNAEVMVADSMWVLGNVICNTTLNETNQYFELFDKIYQPLANLSYIQSNGTFANNDSIYTYHANGDQKGFGIVLESTPTNSSAGFLFVTVREGDLNDNAIYNTANAIGANLDILDGYADLTVTGNVFSIHDNVIFYVSNVTGTFINGEELSQNVGGHTANCLVVNSAILLGNGSIQANNRFGYMLPGNVVGLESGATAYIDQIEVTVGVKDTSGDPSILRRAHFMNVASGTTGFVTRFSLGNSAAAEVANLDITEDVILNNDLIYPTLSINIDAEYEFLAMENANLASTLEESLTYDTYTIGRIAVLDTTNQGTGYTARPAIRPYQTLVFPLLREGWGMDIANVAGGFQPGELVTQSATGARGFLIDSTSNNQHYIVGRASLFDDFVATINSTTRLVGEASGATANITYLEEYDQYTPLDIREEIVGINANVSSNVQTATGAIVSLAVTDSGFGFYANDIASFVSEDGERVGSARVILGKQGVGSGYYKVQGGFLSAHKKLQDNDYWQDFSYEVRSSMTLNKYRDMLRNILHVAGTKAFGAFYYRTVANCEATAITESVIQED
jgi:hypothetical protein